MNQKFQFCKRRMTRGLGVHRKSSCRPAGPSAGRLVTLLAIFGISFASHAQSPQVRAQFLYTAAIEDMNAKRFDACVQKLGEARQLLGRIVAKIQAPLTRCHYGRGAWDDTAAAARAYFEVQSDTALVEYNEIGKILLEVETKIKDRNDRLERERRAAEAAQKKAARAEEEARKKAAQERQARIGRAQVLYPEYLRRAHESRNEADFLETVHTVKLIGGGAGMIAGGVLFAIGAIPLLRGEMEEEVALWYLIPGAILGGFGTPAFFISWDEPSGAADANARAAEYESLAREEEKILKDAGMAH